VSAPNTQASVRAQPLTKGSSCWCGLLLFCIAKFTRLFKVFVKVFRGLSNHDLTRKD
jgi:hypothetical protein